MKKGVTLLETVVVILILAIIATIAVPYYNKIKEKTYDNQAFSDLKIIQMAEKGYYIDMNTYYPSSGSVTDIPTINNNLKLNLPGTTPANPSQAWEYTVNSTGCAHATSRIGTSRNWCLSVNDAAGVPDSGTCGSAVCP